MRDLPPARRTALAKRLAGVLKINVLRAFHTSKPEAMTPLFSWDRDDWITLPRDVVAFVGDNATALEAIANLWWARYLEKVNLLAPLVIEKVERDGAQRGSLGKYLSILRAVDGERCFYCERPFSAQRTIHIDHVIPWSFLLSDPLWDLVLACRPCNLSKSDTLPHHDFIGKLVATHAARAKVHVPPRVASPIIESTEVDRFYSAALSVEWPAGWIPPGR